jgi:hypothetical protein
MKRNLPAACTCYWNQFVSNRQRTYLITTVALSLALPLFGSAAPTILWLKTGDRIVGNIVSEDTNCVVLSTSWIKELSVPVSAIQHRESPALLPDMIPPTPRTQIITPSDKLEPLKPKSWKVEVRAGADFLSGPKNQQIYYGRLKHTYTYPYTTRPNHSFRNVFDGAVDYGVTQNSGSGGNNGSVLSANRLFASDKTDFDIGSDRWFIYDLASLGYDDIRKINFQYAIGPGLGYHLLTQRDWQLNGELGVDYQEQHRADKTTTRNLFFRLGQDSTWKVNSGLSFTERFDFLPRADAADFRARAEATLSYALWRNVSLHLSMLDLYDTKPAQSVTSNDLQVHTSVGVTF